MHRRNRLIHPLGLLAILLPTSVTSAQTNPPVALELVLAVDTSTSVDDREFELQTQGLAAAFRHPSVVRAIEKHKPEGIAVSIIHWSGQGRQKTSVDWTRLRTGQSSASFADRIAAAPRLLRGFTDIAGAVRFAQKSLFRNRYEGKRLVIDVSGDGSSNGQNARAARDSALAAGITVNGLVIHNEEYDLGELAKINLVDHYRNNVVGGPGSFLIIAKDFQDFRIAIRKKLVREITGPLFSQVADQASAIE